MLLYLLPFLNPSSILQVEALSRVSDPAKVAECAAHVLKAMN